MGAQRGIQRVTRMPGLNPHLAGRGLPGIAPGTAAGLHQQGKQALRRAEVAGEQAAVGVDGRHQRDAPEVVALGHHLGANQDIDFASVHRPELRFERPFQARAVGIDAGHARARQGQCELLFELLGAAADRLDVEIAAVGAGPRHAFRETAMMAAQRAVALVKDPPGAAVRAAALPGTRAAVQHRRVAAAVEQHQALLAAGQSRLQRLQQGRREGGATRRLARLQRHVHQAHARQGPAADTLGQTEPAVGALLGALPALQRRGGRPKHDRHVLQPPAVDRQIARRVARALLLLERRVVFFIDHDQTQARHRGKHRQPGAEHQIGVAKVGREPMAQALRRRQSAVQRYQAVRGKTGRKTGLELGRQVDLRHQHQHLPAAGQGLRCRLQIDLRLAAAGDAMQ